MFLPKYETKFQLPEYCLRSGLKSMSVERKRKKEREKERERERARESERESVCVRLITILDMGQITYKQYRRHIMIGRMRFE